MILGIVALVSGHAVAVAARAPVEAQIPRPPESVSVSASPIDFASRPVVEAPRPAETMPTQVADSPTADSPTAEDTDAEKTSVAMPRRLTPDQAEPLEPKAGSQSSEAKGPTKSPVNIAEQKSQQLSRPVTPLKDPAGEKATTDDAAAKSTTDTAVPVKAEDKTPRWIVPDDPLARKVAQAIDITSRRILSVDTHTPWQIGHGVMALRHQYELQIGDERINAIEWISDNPRFGGEPWWYATRYGAKPHPFSEPYAFEGHPNQFLAFLAMSRLPLDHKFKVAPDRTATLADFIENAKMTIDKREETTWTLWFFAYYLDSDESWVNERREPWSMERMLREEMSIPVTKKACGGNHGLFALASARNAYLQGGKRLRGVWLQSHYFLARHAELARRLQNADGSFSSNYYKGRGYSKDPSKRVSTSGHTLEFLMMSLPKQQLKQSWVRRGIENIADDLIKYQAEPLDVGGMYHALHAMIIYRERTFEKDTRRPLPLVGRLPWRR
ncbi:hypothetical protein Pan189_26070 [Stratiformator vulcanicus]|uniref:Uncharacterized protein n=1 Tax=Stratiformator vulcanicus TaxID=2527980 RepID=A0A517R2V6_9PLAN|nr:hypothetical protein Pan189_26070 [Stratiformator vulcanicus]